jgi:hypothetical protein
MLEKLSREEILEMYLALRRDYFDVTMELVDQERALRQAYALIEKNQMDWQRGFQELAFVRHFLFNMWCKDELYKNHALERDDEKTSVSSQTADSQNSSV